VPKFCSMRISHEVRDAMAEKSREFAEPRQPDLPTLDAMT
jgi:hypothetical protein